MMWQDEVFSERLTRLEQTQTRRKIAKPQVETRPALDIGRFASLASAAMIGAMAVPLSQLAIFHSQGLGNASANPELVMATNGIFAFCIAFFLVRMVLSVSCLNHMMAKVAGVWIALTTMHNLVHAYPTFWTQAFSAEWVERVLLTTNAGTIYIAGVGLPGT